MPAGTVDCCTPPGESTQGRIFVHQALRWSEHEQRREDMQVVYERCCGIDVHKQTVVACAIVPGQTVSQ